HNAQPWLFHAEMEQIELYADLRRALPAVDPSNRELVIGCGAALHNLVLALQHFGYDCSVEIIAKSMTPAKEDTKVLLARVQIASFAERSPEEGDLFQVITKRRTSRMQFESRPIPDSFLAEIERIARNHGAWVRPLQGKSARESMANCVAQAN